MRFLKLVWFGMLRLKRLSRGGHNDGGTSPPSLPGGCNHNEQLRTGNNRPPPPHPHGQQQQHQHGSCGAIPDEDTKQRCPDGADPNQHHNVVPPQHAEHDWGHCDGEPQPKAEDQPPEPPEELVATEDVSVMKDSPGLDLSKMEKECTLKGVAKLCRKKTLPLELASKCTLFASPPLLPSDFEAPPMVLLLSQCSVRKMSFVKHLLGRDFPGVHVGPEPTTGRFIVVLCGERGKVVPGAALCSQTHRQFAGLSPFGNNFLSRMEGVELDCPILKDVTLVDTQGVLSRQKQRSRNCDCEGAIKWFAERADLIIVMFDAHKLDVPDELQSVMELMIPHLKKLCTVLNKADSISTQQLMRVYGALMLSLGKATNTTEACRVHRGSFWGHPLTNLEQTEPLQRVERDLLKDMQKLLQQAVVRKINDLVKRARNVKVHACIVHHLQKQLPHRWGKQEQARLVRRLDGELMAAARRCGLPRGDLPPVRLMQQALSEIKGLSEFPKLDKKLAKEMDKLFTVDVPHLRESKQNGANETQRDTN